MSHDAVHSTLIARVENADRSTGSARHGCETHTISNSCDAPPVHLIATEGPLALVVVRYGEAASEIHGFAMNVSSRRDTDTSSHIRFLAVQREIADQLDRVGQSDEYPVGPCIVSNVTILEIE